MPRIVEIIEALIQKSYEFNNSLDLDPINSTIDTFTVVSITLLSISLVIFTVGLPLLKDVAISERRFTFNLLEKLAPTFREEPEVIKEKLKDNPDFTEFSRGTTAYMDHWARLNLYRHLSIVSFLISSISFVSVILLFKSNFSIILVLLYLMLLISILFRRTAFRTLESSQSLRFNVKIIFYMSSIPIFLVSLIKLIVLENFFSYIYYPLGIACLFFGMAVMMVAIKSTIEANEELMRGEIGEFFSEKSEEE